MPNGFGTYCRCAKGVIKMCQDVSNITMNLLSLDATISVTSWSRRTWWRRLAEGLVTRASDDARGRAMISWIDVEARLLVLLSEEDRTVLQKADAGHADAQNDIGQLLTGSRHYDGALHWIRQAAAQDHPDAMQWLGRMYASGEGVERDENFALMWIAKAAAFGHVIADQQIKFIRSRS